MNSLLIAYSPTAIEELLEIENYLESQDIGAKQRFRDEFDAELKPLLLFPESFISRIRTHDLQTKYPKTIEETISV
jgi:plasmid stabilization system protein ParE